MTKENESLDVKTGIIAETEHYLAWQANEPDDEITYHLELNNVTVHFFAEEWDEFLVLAKTLIEES